MDNNKDNKSAVIGSYKEYILIEREDIQTLKDKAIELLKGADNDTSKYYEAMGIMDSIRFIKERNVYNREFKYKT
jgi:hypothetical protein